MKKDLEDKVFDLMDAGSGGLYKDPFAWMVKPKKKKKRKSRKYSRGKQQQQLDNPAPTSSGSGFDPSEMSFDDFYAQYGNPDLTMYDVGGPIDDYWYELWMDFQAGYWQPPEGP